MTHYANDTICALATPVGGAIAVVRVNGSQSYPVLGRLLRQDLSACAPATLRHASLYSPEGEEIDDVVVAFYRAPHSYTGEDAIEISCHGSAYIVHQILDALTKAGCRQAEPGEYTRRAYLNGKMDLSQAEAVADLISSSNQASHRLALSQLKGHVRTALETLRERLLRLTSLLELELDFSDHDDLVFADRSELLSLARSIEDHVAALARTYHIGKAVKEGIPVAIVGKTNVGKSTLLNHLVGEDRALVSDVHGTTRDSIEETTLIGGLTFRFVDTAGLRHTDDVVEQMGIERTWQKLDEALLVLWVVDRWPTQEETDEMVAHCPIASSPPHLRQDGPRPRRPGGSHPPGGRYSRDPRGRRRHHLRAPVRPADRCGPGAAARRRWSPERPALRPRGRRPTHGPRHPRRRHGRRAHHAPGHAQQHLFLVLHR